MNLDFSRESEGPPILQLHKWGPPGLQLNLSEFREGFISPTRDLILLHSYHCEAVLIPLPKAEESVASREPEDSDCNSIPACSPDQEAATSTSLSSGADSNCVRSSENDTLKSNDYHFLCGVTSLAWGICGDSCYQPHEDSLFRELLFVCGNHGVTAHAFRQSYKSSESVGLSQEADIIEGSWMDWGPMMASSHDMGAPEHHSSILSEASIDVCDVSKTDVQGQRTDGTCVEAESEKLPRSDARKIWLKTFFTKTETLRCASNVYTKFPDRSFPSCAKIVSFSIFGSDSPLLDFLSHHDFVSHKQENFRTLDPVNITCTELDSKISSNTEEDDAISNSSSVKTSRSCKCFKVFSSNSHCLIGFALALRIVVLDSGGATLGQTSEVLVAVARIVKQGMQWLCSVKLEESPEREPEVEWLDFKFFHMFLICLNASGYVAFYVATTGEYVASVDLSHACGFPSLLISEEQRSSEVNYRIAKRNFKRIVTVPDSSVFGVIDSSGITYLVRAEDHIPGKYFPFLKLFHHAQFSGLGILVNWEVGASEIGYRDTVSHYSCSQSINIPQSTGLHKKHENRHERIGSHHFSEVRQVRDQEKFFGSALPSRIMRKAFLPSDRSNEDDVVCFSPFGITRLLKRPSCKRKRCQLVHSNLHVDFAMTDDRDYTVQSLEASLEDTVGSVFQGSLYLVKEDGLFVVLPSLSVSSSSNFFPVENIGYCQMNFICGTKCQADKLLDHEVAHERWPPWKLEILDRAILYEGLEEADRLCLTNGWGLEVSRIRHLQLSLNYLKLEEIENSLERLAFVELAEEGILRLLFAAVYLMFHKVGRDSEVTSASRLLGLATSFATKMIRQYGSALYVEHEPVSSESSQVKYIQHSSNPSELVGKRLDKITTLKRLQEMAHFLEIIRDLQWQLNLKFKTSGQGLVDNAGALSLMDSDLSDDKPRLPNVSDTASDVHPHPVSDDENLSLVPRDTTKANLNMLLDNSDRDSVLGFDGSTFRKGVVSFENPKDMITRWELDNLDLKNIVKDALYSGRLPLAVLKLHLHRVRDTVTDSEANDTFDEVRDIGRAIAYDLFLKGETGLAAVTLQKLGEDMETSLKQLLFGTVRRSLRKLIAQEMERHGLLGSHEWKILERISLIERVYPCSSFWNAFYSRQEDMKRSIDDVHEEISLSLLHPIYNDLKIICGEIDGVVLGSWKTINEQVVHPEIDDDSAHAGYWTSAAVWSDAWDRRTIDRIVLDQPFLMGVNVLWESQLEYYICHNDWLEALKLLEILPSYALRDGNLSISLDGVRSTSTVECSQGLQDYNYVYSLEELDSVFINVPNVRIFSIPANNMCSLWLRILMGKQLAKKLIFLKDFWESTVELLSLLAWSGFIVDGYSTSSVDDSIEDSSDPVLSTSDITIHPDATLALHKVFIHFCAQHNLLNLLDLYLDRHKLAADHDSLLLIQDAAGDNQWMKWLLLLRVKGKEYDASFSNARAVASRNIVHGTSLRDLDIDDIIHTVDDIAEGAGEMAALATLMFAPVPIQDCLSSGGVNRHYSSAQCTLENLRPALQRFPTLWRSLVAACFGQDSTCNFYGPRVKVSGYSDLLDYLSWREDIFFSSGRDTSLLQMLPCWIPKAVRRLVQLYVKGPLGWQSLADLPTGELFMPRDIGYLLSSDDHAEISAMSWEAAIQKHIEEELYASSMEEAGLGLEHHLHRGRALAAFSNLLSVRIQKLKMENLHKGPSGQTNLQSDVLTLLSPMTRNEESILSSVMPLAIVHFEDSVLVASCAFLLELCGLSASILRTDVAALRRISSFYKAGEPRDHSKQLSPKSSAFHSAALEGNVAESLARALADDYLHHDHNNSMNERSNGIALDGKQPSRALLLVLQHLEKASLTLSTDGVTCGTWLLTGNGDGAELRSQQKAMSQHWNLVTVFCQMHHMPLSTKYLAVLAKDNDWVGFLSEAQLGGYPFESVIQVASREFSDLRLRIHIMTVLRSMQMKKKINSSLSDASEKTNEMPFLDENPCNPVELFGILADCEKQKNPGKTLLLKAKNLCWSILALIASCFPDVSPLSCLTVWLEITAARETSAIKVNDVASQIASNVGAAVQATNSLPSSVRTVTYHYNRKNSKRRRLFEPSSLDTLDSTSSDSTISSSTKLQGIIGEDEMQKQSSDAVRVLNDSDEVALSLSRMVAVLCEQKLFLPLLRAFEMFLPSCALLPFIRALQAFSQMRLTEASAHLGSFSTRIREEAPLQTSNGRGVQIGNSWIWSTAMKAADALLSTCPSPYEKRCLLHLLAATDFGDGGSATAYYRRLYWKINLAEPSLRVDGGLHLGSETLDDASLLTALQKNGSWDQARNWARNLEASGGSWKSAAHHVTEMQAESLVAEWKEFLWDVPEERVALWSHCQTLFLRHSFPALQAGLFFLKQAEAAEKDLPARELHEVLLLSLQWLSGMITQSSPVYPLHLLREIETRVWLLAVESETQVKSEGEVMPRISIREAGTGKASNIIDRTASIITKMDHHIDIVRIKTPEKTDTRENNLAHRISQVAESSSSSISTGNIKARRRAKGFIPSRGPLIDSGDKAYDANCSSTPLNQGNDAQLFDEDIKLEASFSNWEERIGHAELERAVLSLLEFGQITAAKQLQSKLSPGYIPSEFLVIDAALKLAARSTPNNDVSVSMLDDEVSSVIQQYNLATDGVIQPLQVLECLTAIVAEGTGRGLCKRLVSVAKAANVLGISFSEAYDKQPDELLQLLTLKAQDSFEEAKLLVQTHTIPAARIAHILAESFLKGLLAAHRGGYMDSQKEEGPAPLLWRFADFLKWADICPSEPEVGHALMRLVITGQEIPHACEVELLILSHHFYKSSACLDGVDVLVALAATRVEAYVSEGDFPCLARLITGVGNFHALNFILGILIENGQLDLLLQKYSAAADANTSTAEAVRGFRMAVLTALKQFNPNDLDAFAMVYSHFDMKHETAALLESRAEQSSLQWLLRYDKDQNEDLLESMRYFIEAAEVHSSIDAGNKTRRSCAQASLVSLQIRMPDIQWLNLSETNARRALVEQSRFQEALIVAEAYNLNQSSEWALVLWNQMLNPELTEEFVAEFVAVLPLQPSMLAELARFYRAEVAARGDQSQFSVWLTGGGLPAEWAKYLGRSFRCLLLRTRDLRLRSQLATAATGFADVIAGCNTALDKVPDNAGPLVLRRGHGGAYLPLM